MSTTEHIVIVDDLDGSTEGVEPVWVGLDGTLDEIDLSPRHREQLRAALEPFMARARPLRESQNEYDPLPQAKPARQPQRACPVLRDGARHRGGDQVGHQGLEHLWGPLAKVPQALGREVRAWAAQQGTPCRAGGSPGRC